MGLEPHKCGTLAFGFGIYVDTILGVFVLQRVGNSNAY